jgi:hypothetical protein
LAQSPIQRHYPDRQLCPWTVEIDPQLHLQQGHNRQNISYQTWRFRDADYWREQEFEKVTAREFGIAFNTPARHH